MAMTLVRGFVKCIGKSSFFALLSDASGPTALRSRKGVLWDYKELRQLPHTTFEIDCGYGKTRLGAIVDFSDFSFDSAASALLNWGAMLDYSFNGYIKHRKTTCGALGIERCR